MAKGNEHKYSKEKEIVRECVERLLPKYYSSTHLRLKRKIVAREGEEKDKEFTKDTLKDLSEILNKLIDNFSVNVNI